MSEPHGDAGPQVQSFIASLRVLTGNPVKDRIFVADVMQLIPDRALLAMILLFSVPNMIPMPPGTSAVLGAPLVILCLQWMLGRGAWLPPAIARRSMARADVQWLVRRAEPWLIRGDGLLRPRFALVLGRWGERFASAVSVLLALILVLPIPLGNMAPAFAISVLAVGFLRRDGLWVAAGIMAALASIAVAIEAAHTLAMALAR